MLFKIRKKIRTKKFSVSLENVILLVKLPHCLAQKNLLKENFKKNLSMKNSNLKRI